MPKIQDHIPSVDGFRVAGVATGIKKSGDLDFALIVSDAPCAAAGVFTRNLVKAAPVLVDQAKLRKTGGVVRAVAVNSGCANACTGQQGMDNANETARLIAEKIGCSEDEVLVMSTGVIGPQLPMDNIKHGVDLAIDALGDHWEAAARAIMTTDTRPKLAYHSDDAATIAGIAKGAGMIAPDMATMLGLIVTDSQLNATHTQDYLSQANQTTFNSIVVDGDMSTNDTVLFLANGLRPFAMEKRQHYIDGLHGVARKLALDIVRDAEGASKFVTISVRGATDNPAAHKIASTIATSPLVKTAFFGDDANWGRIIAAMGRAGVDVDPMRVSLHSAPGEQTVPGDDALLLFDGGQPVAYSEAVATAIVSEDAFSYVITCGDGPGHAIVYTCDLSHDYVSINADYRT